MEFKSPYLHAMREQTPRLFNELRRTGARDAHLQAKSAEAHRLFDDLTSDLPKPLTDQQHSETARLVLETLIEFPS